MIGIYLRVSSRSQDNASQKEDLIRWHAAQDQNAVWYTDSFSGRTMDRPGFNKLLRDVHSGKVKTIAVWRLDRLGRTAKGLTALFDDLHQRGVNLVSLRDGLDLGTPAGRLMANVLASVAAYETEVRYERQRAGIAAARVSGKAWGGPVNTGKRLHVKPEQIEVVRRMKAEGSSVYSMVRATGLSKPTVYTILKREASQ